MRFRARADLEGGRWVRDSKFPDNSLFAVTPAAAARKLFWRMTPAQRAACWRVVVGAFPRPHPCMYATYDGPPRGFDPRQRWAELQPGQAGSRP